MWRFEEDAHNLPIFGMCNKNDGIILKNIKVGITINIGGVLYFVLMFLLIFGTIISLFFAIRIIIKRSNNTNNIEQKLDKIIELLEKDKRK